MPIFACTNGKQTTALVEATNFAQARRALCLPKSAPMVQLPERHPGWSFNDADLHLFPLPLAPLGGP